MIILKKNDGDLTKLLIKSSNKDFEPSQEIFCLFLVKKYQFDLQCIETKIQN